MILNINAYLHSLMLDPNGFYTPTSLRIPHDLCTLFHLLRRNADYYVREYGRSMYWQGGVQKELVPNPVNFIGDVGGKSVDMRVLEERERHDYIGNFHVHPYEKKYGAGIGIGPSHGDWNNWWLHPPAHHDVAVRFVASGSDLFLLIFRRAPVGPLSFAGITSDVARLNETMRSWNMGDADEFDVAIRAHEWAQAQQLMKRISPQAFGMHRDDAHRMNIELATANRCEYFKGTLRNGTSTLYLASARVLGNWLTSNFWSTSNAPWLNWP